MRKDSSPISLPQQGATTPSRMVGTDQTWRDETRRCLGRLHRLINTRLPVTEVDAAKLASTAILTSFCERDELALLLARAPAVLNWNRSDAIEAVSSVIRWCDLILPMLQRFCWLPFVSQDGAQAEACATQSGGAIASETTQRRLRSWRGRMAVLRDILALPGGDCCHFLSSVIEDVVATRIDGTSWHNTDPLQHAARMEAWRIALFRHASRLEQIIAAYQLPQPNWRDALGKGQAIRSAVFSLKNSDPHSTIGLWLIPHHTSRGILTVPLPGTHASTSTQPELISACRSALQCHTEWQRQPASPSFSGLTLFYRYEDEFLPTSPTRKDARQKPIQLGLPLFLAVTHLLRDAQTIPPMLPCGELPAPATAHAAIQHAQPSPPAHITSPTPNQDCHGGAHIGLRLIADDDHDGPVLVADIDCGYVEAELAGGLLRFAPSRLQIDISCQNVTAKSALAHQLNLAPGLPSPFHGALVPPWRIHMLGRLCFALEPTDSGQILAGSAHGIRLFALTAWPEPGSTWHISAEMTARPRDLCFVGTSNLPTGGMDHPNHRATRKILLAKLAMRRFTPHLARAILTS